MTGPFVRTVVERDEAGSTSDLARDLVAGGDLALPLLVRARRQTRGRGRGSNAWWSDEGSLSVTIALDPAEGSLSVTIALDPAAHGLQTRHEPRLALGAAIALADALAPLVAPTVPLGVRWPNDVEAAGRKLSGILPERVETADGVRLLIGVGVNVRTRLGDAPPEVRRMAVSLDEVAADPGAPPGPDVVLSALLEHLPATLDRLAADDPGLAERWAALDTLRGQAVRVDLGTHVVSGVGCGVDPEGALCLATEGQTLRLFGGRVLRDVL